MSCIHVGSAPTGLRGSQLTVRLSVPDYKGHRPFDKAFVVSMLHWHCGLSLIQNVPITAWRCVLLLYWASQTSHSPWSEEMAGGGGNGMQLQTQLGPLGAPGSFTEGGGTAKGNEAVKGERRGCVCIFWSRGVVCSSWQLIPHAGGRLSRQADQKVKAPGGPPFEMGMGPRYQTENISKLPATEQLHIHGWDWR